MYSSHRDLISLRESIAPPSANHAPNMNSSCQVNGLKYQPPDGKPGKFQPNQRAAK